MFGGRQHVQPMTATARSAASSDDASWHVEALLRVEHHRRELLRAEGALEAAADYVAQSRGKRLRPLLLLCFACLGQPRPRPREETLRAAAAVEVLHEASLVHDDVVDNSLVRRGQPAVAQQFTVSTACYLGLFMAARAFVALAEACDCAGVELDASVVQRLSRAQLLEGLKPSATSSWQARLTDVVDGKTGALFAFAAQLGAGLAPWQGASAPKAELVDGVARRLALAFQIRDDLADLENDPHIRKPGGNDLFRGVPTWPFSVWAAAQSDPRAAWQRLATCRGDVDAARMLQHEITVAGVAQRVRDSIQVELDAVSLLLNEAADGPARQTLFRIVDEVRP